MAFQGIGGAAGFAVNYAVNITDKENSQYSDKQLTDLWSGYFHKRNQGLSMTKVYPAGFGLFWKDGFVGGALMVGAGIGGFSTHAFYHKYYSQVVSSASELYQISQIFANGDHLKAWVADRILLAKP